MTFNEKNLAGCARISMNFHKIYSKQIPLGCFETSLDEESNIETIDENKIIGKTDQNESNRQTYISRIQTEKIGETYTLRNQNERNRENIGNKQGSLQKNWNNWLPVNAPLVHKPMEYSNQANRKDFFVQKYVLHNYT